MPDHNPFQGITDLFTEFGRMRETGTHGRELASQDRQRTHASAWVPTTDIFALGDRLVIRIELAALVEIVVEGIHPRADSSRIQLRDRSGAATTRTLS